MKCVNPPKELIIGRGETHEQVKFSVNYATVGVCTSYERTSGDGIPSLVNIGAGRKHTGGQAEAGSWRGIPVWQGPGLGIGV